jgi:hypothetical protein
MMIRPMVALLALYIVSGGGKDWAGFAGFDAAAPAGEKLAGQAAFAKQALDFCFSHRDLCTAAASGLIGTTGSVPAATQPPVPAPSAEGLPLLMAAPHLPLPPRRRAGTPAGA